MPKLKKKSKTKSLNKKSIKKKNVKKPVKKTKKITAVPKGYNSITPYLIVNNAADAIYFYSNVFNAKEVMRMEHQGRIMHAELKIGDAKVMLADACPEMNFKTPQDLGGSPIGVLVYVKNVDAVVNQAVASGASLDRPIQDMFYGDRTGSIIDPFGHRWTVATHIEDVSPAKMRKRAAELFS